jgi:hypothetical protein
METDRFAGGHPQRRSMNTEDQLPLLSSTDQEDAVDQQG